MGLLALPWIALEPHAIDKKILVTVKKLIQAGIQLYMNEFAQLVSVLRDKSQREMVTRCQ